MPFSVSSVFWVLISGITAVTTPDLILFLPALFAGSAGSRLRPVSIVLGMAISFTLTATLVSNLGVAISFFVAGLRLVSTFFIVCIGAVLFDNNINQLYMNISNLIANFWRKHIFHENAKLIIAREEFLVGLFLGISIGVIWIPRVGPILGTILAYTARATSVGNLLYGAILFLIYSLGLCITIFIIIYFMNSTLGWAKVFEKRRLFFKKLSGLILILTGLMVLFGIEKYLLRLLIPYSPFLESYLWVRYNKYISFNLF